jgi:uncharacterized delta-60 repeat protein
MRKLNKTFLCTIFLTILLLYPTCSSHAISLDQQFGVNGEVITPFSRDSNPTSIAVQPDEKITVVGNSSNGNNYDWSIVRYNSNGALDANFGTNGKIIQDLGVNDTLEVIILQPNEKLLTGGFSQPIGNFLWTLARYDSIGVLDSSFGNDGIVTTTFNTNLSVLKDLVLLDDGKIIGVGYAKTGGNDNVALARYNPDGSLDTNFGTSGIVTTPIGGSNDRGNAVTLQPDGKILVAGDFDAGGQDRIFLARYNPNGTLDTSFDSDGKVTTQIGAHDNAKGLRLQPDGKIIISGGTNFISSADTYAARYNPNGTLDTTFDSDGKFIKSFAIGSDASTSLVLQPDNKILLGGYEQTANGLDFALRRLNSNGALDNTFGTSGSLITSLSSNDDLIASINLQTNNLVVTGPVSNGSHNDWGIIKFKTNNLNIPILKQGISPFDNDSPTWEDEEYAFGNKENYWCGSTIAECGCAMTSVTMLLRKFGVVNPENGSEITPSSVNSYFKRDPQCGLSGCISLGYSFGNVRWGAVDKLTADSNLHYSTQKLIYNGGAAFNAITVAQDIDNDRPVILGVPNHWVLATGKAPDSSTFTINDPLFNRTLLSDSPYNNTASQGMRRYKTTNSDFSSIEIAVLAPTQIIITDPDGNRTGYNTASSSAVSEIPNSEYFFDEAYAPGEVPTPNTGVFWIKILTPQKGEYKVEVNSSANHPYGLAIYGSDRDANTNFRLLEGEITSDSQEIYIINYDPDLSTPMSVSKVDNVVTFDILISHLKSFKSEGKITSNLVYKTLIFEAEAAKKASMLKQQPLGNKLAILALKAFQFHLNLHRGKLINEHAYKVLNNDAASLIKTLQK